MTEIVDVRFSETGKIYTFDANGLAVKPGDRVVAETARGIEIGQVMQGNRPAEEPKKEPVAAPDAAENSEESGKAEAHKEKAPAHKPLLRIATKEDLSQWQENKKKEKEAFRICADCVRKSNLDMRLVRAEYAFDGSKLVFYFTAENRVDFRELVKELAGIFHTRIELRQVGVRDEAKMLGGIGICGLPFCCASFLNDFQPVSIKMAKEQSLSLNPTKISGACGRLMCCLKYEQDAYEDAAKRLPRMGSVVETPDGIGVVTETALVKERIRVRLNQSPEQPPQFYPAAECRLLRRRGEAPSPEELAEERGEYHPPKLQRDPLICPCRQWEREEPATDQEYPADTPVREPAVTPDAHQEPAAGNEKQRNQSHPDRSRNRNRHRRQNGQQQPRQGKGGNEEQAKQQKQGQQNRPPRPAKPEGGNPPAGGESATNGNKQNGETRSKSHRGGRNRHRGRGNRGNGTQGGNGTNNG